MKRVDLSTSRFGNLVVLTVQLANFWRDRQMSMMRYRAHDSLAVLKNPLYGRHVQAMTAEELHSKAEIAEELAARDMRIAELTADLEREEIRLAACGVVAMADTSESAAKVRVMRPDYRSAACDDVARRVDECIALRAYVTELREVLEIARNGINWYIENSEEANGCDEEMLEQIATVLAAAPKVT